MGIDARIQSEVGEKIQELFDPYDLVAELLPDFSDNSSICLRFVDPYGDTIFNQGQIPVLIKELEVAIEKCKNPKAKEHGKKVLKLSKQADRKVHTYLKFIGD